MHEMPPKHRGRWKYCGSEPRTRGGVKGNNLIYVEAMFDEKEELLRERLEKILTCPVRDGARDISTAGDKVSPAVADDGEVVHKVASLAQNVEKGHTVDSCRRQSNDDVRLLFCLLKRRGMLVLLRISPLMLMHRLIPLILAELLTL